MISHRQGWDTLNLVLADAAVPSGVPRLPGLYLLLPPGLPTLASLLPACPLQEWITPQPSRRPDIFPEFEKLQTPLPKPMPGDPEVRRDP